MGLLWILHNRNDGVSRVTTHNGHRASVGAVGVRIDVFKPYTLLSYSLDVGRYGLAIHLLVGNGTSQTLKHNKYHIRALRFED